MNEQSAMSPTTEAIQPTAEQATEDLMGPTIEQKRAAFLLERIKTRWLDEEGNVKATTQKQAQDYRRIVQRLPAMIMTNGLGQAVAFLMSDTQNRAAQAVVQDLREGLVSIRGLYYGSTSNLSLIERIVKGDRETLRQATDEALALLTWWVRFVRAFLPKPEGD